jgi:hypothetical protein
LASVVDLIKLHELKTVNTLGLYSLNIFLPNLRLVKNKLEC